MSSNLSIPLIDHPLFNKDTSELKVTFARSEVGHPLAHVIAGAPQLADVVLQLLHLNLLKIKRIKTKLDTKQRSFRC